MKHRARDIDIELARRLFVVRDGQLYRRIRSGARGLPGALAGWAQKGGYRRVRIAGVTYLVHRVIFALVHGRQPAWDLDHQDIDPRNNTAGNLREATASQNCANIRPKQSRLGVRNVYQRPSGRYHVQVRCRGRIYHFGDWPELEFADLVAQEARHRLFGAFAPVLS